MHVFLAQLFLGNGAHHAAFVSAHSSCDAIVALLDSHPEARRLSAKPAPVTVEECLLASLKRCTFLLNSARMVIDDPVANQVAANAVAEARAVTAMACMEGGAA